MGDQWVKIRKKKETFDIAINQAQPPSPRLFAPIKEEKRNSDGPLCGLIADSVIAAAVFAFTPARSCLVTPDSSKKPVTVAHVHSILLAIISTLIHPRLRAQEVAKKGKRRGIYSLQSIYCDQWQCVCCWATAYAITRWGRRRGGRENRRQLLAQITSVQPTHTANVFITGKCPHTSMRVAKGQQQPQHCLKSNMF